VQDKNVFNETILMDDDSFHIVLYLDGLTCGPCTSARTNALRLSAGLLGLEAGKNITVNYFDCSLDRKFCQDANVPNPPFAPQIFGYGIGKSGLVGDGELLYNANEIPPHAALQLIESVIRLSTKVEENSIDANLGKEARWDEGESDEDEPPPPPPKNSDQWRGNDKVKKLHWNGPSARSAMNGASGGGVRSNNMLGR